MRKVLSRRSICSSRRPVASIPSLPWPHPPSTHTPNPPPTIATRQTTTSLLLVLLLVHHISVRQLLLVLLVLLQGHLPTILDLLLLERGLAS